MGKCKKGMVYLPDEVMGMDLSTGAKLTYSVLAVCAGNRAYAWPGQDYLARRVSRRCGASSGTWGSWLGGVSSSCRGRASMVRGVAFIDFRAPRPTWDKVGRNREKSEWRDIAKWRAQRRWLDVGPAVFATA